MMDERVSGRRRVLVFRNELLPRSETFILSQTAALARYEPVFAAVHPATSSLELPSEAVFLDETGSVLGKIRRRLFWRYGWGRRFYRRLQGVDVCCVHAHFAVDGAAALPIAERLGIPLVVTLHGYDVTASDATHARNAEGRVYLRRRTRLWERASAFLCISKFMYEKALEKGFPPEKLRLLYTGTDLEVFQKMESVRDRGLIVFVGRLVEKKGLRYLLDAMRIVRESHPAAELVVLGAGPLEDEMKQRAAEEGLRCRFLGMQPAEVVRSYLAQARVFCVPSVSAGSGDSEGLGMVFIEAQAMGTPVASFRHGGIPEAVVDGETGLLAEERDGEGLARNLGRLLSDDAMWARMSVKGVEWAGRNFDVRRQTAGLEDVYDAVIGGWSAGKR